MQQKRRQPATRKVSALTALATALAVLAAPLASIQHEATVRHITCLEHGELIDAAPLTAAELAAPAHHHAQSVVEQGERTQRGFAEDLHCLIATGLHQRSTAAEPQSQLSPPDAVALAQVAAAPERRSPPIALIHLAPKLSPPLA